LEETVTVVGRTNDPFELLREKDLLVVPSLFDSYPNVVLEALHTGTPVIGSRVGGIPDILRHEDLLFEPGNPAAIAEKIHKYAADPEEYARIRRLCAERKKDFQFDWIGEFEKIMAPELNR
jgi:glycosyltransferase involved in cell wall biosynthesis